LNAQSVETPRVFSGTKWNQCVVSPEKPIVTLADINRLAPFGAPTKKQALAWGLGWPLKKGWQKTLAGTEAPRQSNGTPRPASAAELFERGATVREITSKRSKRGGYSRKSLAALGVAWPPKAGWRAQLIENARRHGRV
jgi:hypothetical protein